MPRPKGIPAHNRTNIFIECLKCRTKFRVIPCRLKTTKYCSKKCYAKEMSRRISGKNHPMWRDKKKDIVCLDCGESFLGYKSNGTKYCSKSCASKHTGFPKGYTPHNKGLKGYTNVGSFKKGDASLKGMLGKKQTERWKKEQSERLKERFKVNPLSKESRQKIGLANKIRFSNPSERLKVSGINASQYRGGVTPLRKQIRECYEYKIWRADVFERDKFTCQECGVSGCYLCADHITPFAIIIERNKIKTFEQAIKCEELWDINNGRTLCKPCHLVTDTHGYKTKLLIKQLAIS